MTNHLEQDPMKVGLLLMAQIEEQSIQKKEAEKNHQPAQHEMGFSLSFETPEGVISVWSCWLGDQLYIGYPRDWHVSDELIKATLQVEDSKSVAHRKWVGGDVYLQGTRQWAPFYGGKLDGGGRVWVDHTEFHSYGRTFNLIQNEALKKLNYGHDGSMSLHNIGFSYFNEQEPDAPSAKKEHVQPYRDAFIQLALAIANEHGGITAVHVEYDFTVLTPALLETEGYTDIRYVKGNAAYRQSFGGTVVYAKKENEELILNSGNSLVPWSNIRKIPIMGELTVEEVLNKMLVF